jgi:hypothetical protein
MDNACAQEMYSPSQRFSGKQQVNRAATILPFANGGIAHYG